jgi:serine/threonine protein kinase
MKKIGKYEIIEEIGSGGMGVVYRAHDPVLGRDVAIKLIVAKAMDPEMRERFYREARASGKLQHENLAVVYDVGEIEGRPYIVMEYLKGKDLGAIIKAKTPLTLPQKLDYSRQICKGLAFVHSENIIHRDIKPENIMIVGGGKVKILDFGIARPVSSKLTQAGTRVGTPWYMSPEQIKGDGIDKRSDIFSFGVLLYELLTYRRPFEGDDTTVMYKIVHEEPPPFQLDDMEMQEELKALLAKCLAKSANDRFNSFTEVIGALEQAETKWADQQRIKTLLAEAKTLTLQRNFQQALTRFDEILRLDPENAEAKTRRQECLGQDKDRRTMKVMAGQIVGETISHYRILERLGAGGMGVVYKAEDIKLKRLVALKFLLPELSRDESATKRFIREAQAVSSLDHPNICTVHEIDESENGQLFICMTYYEGQTLRDIIRTGKTNLASSLSMAIDIASGIAKAHEDGITHRDLKPSNIIVTKDGVVKIVDFGLAKLASNTKITKTGTTVGTLAYMAPEQIKGHEVDHRCDIWALGVTLYELMTGKLPFEGEQELSLLYAIVNEEPAPPSKINPAISPALESIIRQALQKAPENRFAAMQEMYEALRKARQQTSREKGLTETKSEVSGLTAKGKMFFERREYSDALSRFKAVLEIDPDNEQARELAAECEYKLSELEQIKLLLDAGKRSFEKGALNEALNYFSEILALDPKHAEAADFVARIQKINEQNERIDKLLVDADFYVKREKFAQAVEAYQKILALDPANKAAARGLQKAQKALEESKRAPAMTPRPRTTPVRVPTPRPRVPTPLPTQLARPSKISPKAWRIAAISVAAIAVIGFGLWQILRPSSTEPTEGKTAQQTDSSGPAAEAQKTAARLRAEAEQAGAETWAAMTLQMGAQEQEKGDRALAQDDYAAAQAAHETAAVYFRNAKTEAQQNLKLAESDVNRLSELVMAVKRDMEREKTAAARAGAPTLARIAFNNGLRLEKDGDAKAAAGGEANWRAAQQAYAGARDSFRQAREEVARMAMARTRENAETARTEMINARQQVPGREEDKRANAKYMRGSQAEASGEQLYQSEDYAAAQNSFRQARDLYVEAKRELTTATAAQGQADAARQAMSEAKSKIDKEGAADPQYQQAVQIENDAGAAYRDNNFDRAAERYQAAEKLYLAVGSAAGDKRSRERERLATAEREIQNLINSFKTNFEKRNLAALQALNIFTRKDDAEVWAAFFKDRQNIKNIQVVIGEVSRQISGKNATVSFTARLAFENNKGEKKSTTLPVNWKVEERNGNWVIVDYQ